MNPVIAAPPQPWPNERVESSPAASPAVDFDVHGLVGIRLIGASRRDAAAVARQLGGDHKGSPLQASLTRDPDLIIRFVDAPLGPKAGEVRYLGLDEFGFTDDGFLVLRGKHKSRGVVRVPFEQIGQRCEIVCERGLPAVPYLVPILHLTALGRGFLPLHAAAFEYNGKGVLVTGWSKGGKTEILLAFLSRGAHYIGDEWIYLTADGERMFGLPEPIRVWDWHLEYLPEVRRQLDFKDRARLRAMRMLQALDSRASPGTAPRAGGQAALPPLRLLRRAMPLLERQMHADVPPQRIVGAYSGGGGAGSCPPRQAAPTGGRPDLVVFAMSHAAPEVTVRPMDPAELARRMVFSLRYEQLPLIAAYLAFRFAFPDRANPFVDEVERVQSELLSKALSGKPTVSVGHPYPVALPELFRAIAPYTPR